MSDANRPTDRDIREEENDAGADAADGVDKYRSMTYAEGVSAALRWVLGSDREKPYTED